MNNYFYRTDRGGNVKRKYEKRDAVVTVGEVALRAGFLERFDSGAGILRTEAKIQRGLQAHVPLRGLSGGEVNQTEMKLEDCVL
jgi:hypothetical protein